MGRDQRSPCARHGMMRRVVALALSCVVPLAGCGGHSNVQLNSGGAPASGVSGGTSVHVQSGTSTFGTLLAIGILAGMSYGSDRTIEHAGTRYAASPFSVVAPSARLPELDPARRVVEHDCTKPIVDWSANIKCK